MATLKHIFPSIKQDTNPNSSMQIFKKLQYLSPRVKLLTVPYEVSFLCDPPSDWTWSKMRGYRRLVIFNRVVIMWKLTKFVSYNMYMYTPTVLFSSSSGMLFFLWSTGKCCQLNALSVFINKPPLPLHFLFKNVLDSIVTLCNWWIFGMVTCKIRRPADWQSSDITTSRSSHIIFVSPRLLLSNLKISMPAGRHLIVTLTGCTYLFLQLRWQHKTQPAQSMVLELALDKLYKKGGIIFSSYNFCS